MSKLLALLFVACAGLHGLVEGAPLFRTGFAPTLPFNPSNRIPGSSPFIGSNRQYAEEQNEMVKIAKMLAASSEKVDKAEIQSKDEMGKLFLDTFSTLLSAFEKKLKPKDDLGKTILNGAQSVLSLARKNIGDAETESLANENLSSEEAEEQFDWGQVVVPLVGKLISKAIDGSSNSAEMEVVSRLPEEAKEQIWGQLLGAAAPYLFSKVFGGESSVETAAAVEALPQEAKEQLWGQILSKLAPDPILISKAISGGSTVDTAAIEALPEEAKEQFLGQLLGKLATQFVVNKLGEQLSG